MISSNFVSLGSLFVLGLISNVTAFLDMKGGNMESTTLFISMAILIVVIVLVGLLVNNKTNRHFYLFKNGNCYKY